MKRVINERPPTHWTLNTVKGFGFASDDVGGGGFLPPTVVKEAGITEADLGRGFRAYAFTVAPVPDKSDTFPQISMPIWWDSDQAAALSEHLPGNIREEAMALLNRIDEDLTRVYEMLDLGDD